jgi:hypothetical protein
MRDVWDIVRALERGDRTVLQDELAAGFAPDTACAYIGMTALLGACEANDLEAVQLAAGADPNHQHHDGYDAYHSTKSRAIREVLLRGGFRLLTDGPLTGAGLYAHRVLALAHTPARGAASSTGRACASSTAARCFHRRAAR